MRDIKFRGLNVSTNTFVFGGLVRSEMFGSEHFKDASSSLISDKPFDCEDISTGLSGGRYSYKTRFHKIFDDSVGQFTGLQDINGVDIYEDDMLHELDPCQWNPARVVFRDGAFEINLTKRTRHPINAKYIRENELVIVGNIHENPELLK
ncbi:MAG: hypothetical protein GY804_00030 [Alphaproteobacteria bacterium]|nr:hypothetical protein [Alphaproteobacteria bacterium]